MWQALTLQELCYQKHFHLGELLAAVPTHPKEGFWKAKIGTKFKANRKKTLAKETQAQMQTNGKARTKTVKLYRWNSWRP